MLKPLMLLKEYVPQMRRLQQFLICKMQEEYDRLFLWTPILFSIGISAYFCLSTEPWMGWGLIALSIIITAVVLLRAHFIGRLVSLALLTVVLGFMIPQWKTIWLSTPMITEKVKDVIVRGHVDGLEHRPNNIRVTMSDLTFTHWPESQPQPRKIRLTFRKNGEVLSPGQTIQVPVTLMPARGPVAEGAYDFAFRSYFDELGAVGFASDAAQIVTEQPIGFIAHIRHQLNLALRDKMKDLTGAVACALITGDRSGIPDKVRQQFADSGIAHILAISGLHLSIIAGLVFLLVRRGFCMFPRLALNMPTKKWAAAVSILFTFGYLLLCSGATPAMRAFYMTSFVMLAVILDRAALTLRNVALAAMFILILWPEVLFNPSFQMSFAAVTALIAAYERYRRSQSLFSLSQYNLPKGVNYAAGILLTTLIASVATAPYTIFTFNRFAIHAIEANLIAIPLTTFWIMPAALISVLTLPFGIADYPLIVFGWGIDILIQIADTVSSWPGAVVLVSQMSGWLIGAITLGCLWICIWKTRWRWIGFAPIIVCSIMMTMEKSPNVFVSKQFGLLALKEGNTLWMNDADRGYYVSDTWRQLAGLEHKKELSEHPDFKCDERSCYGKINGVSMNIGRGWRQVPKKCASVMLSLHYNPRYCDPDIQLTSRNLEQEGTYTFELKSGMMIPLETPRTIHRPWSEE
jgi:competence protein ComEC